MLKICFDLFLHSLITIDRQNLKNLVKVQRIQIIEMILLADVDTIQEGALFGCHSDAVCVLDTGGIAQHLLCHADE